MTAPEFDPKGNSLQRWDVLDSPVRLAICAQTAVYRQVRRWLLEHGAQPRPVPFDDQADPDRWTHCLAIAHVPDGLDDFLALMHRVIGAAEPPEHDRRRRRARLLHDP